MNIKFLGMTLLTLMLVNVGTAKAAIYTLDYDYSAETGTATGTFQDVVFGATDKASIDFFISGKETWTNPRTYYSWYYDPHINLSIGGEQILNRYELFQTDTILHFDLGSAALNSLISNQSLTFDIVATNEFWWSDLSPWGGYSDTRFFLDKVVLNVTEASAVPLPAAALLFGTGLVGLAGAAKRRKRVGK